MGSLQALPVFAVRDSGGEFLERHVDDRVEETLGEHLALLALAGAEPTGDLLDTQLLELDRIDRAGVTMR